MASALAVTGSPSDSYQALDNSLASYRCPAASLAPVRASQHSLASSSSSQLTTLIGDGARWLDGVAGQGQLMAGPLSNSDCGFRAADAAVNDTHYLRGHLMLSISGEFLNNIFHSRSHSNIDHLVSQSQPLCRAGAPARGPECPWA